MNFYFTGEFDRTLLEGEGKPLLIDPAEGLVLPPKPITELDRLSYVVNQIENDCQVVPRGAFKFTPLREVRRNEAFRGLTKEEAFKPESYFHFRQVQQKEKREQIDRDDAVYNHDFLDEIQKDYPKNCWTLVKDSSETVATVRSLLWPGYFGYHRACSNVYGGIYFGPGIKNLDLPFMI